MLKSPSLKNDRNLLIIKKQLTLGCKNVSLITKGIMAGSDPQPKKATPPRPAANAPRKPLQVMHISRKAEEEIINKGLIRTLPFMYTGGMDGFFVARIKKAI